MSRFVIVLFICFCWISFAEGERKQLKIYQVGDLVGTLAPAKNLLSYETSPQNAPTIQIESEEDHYYVCSPDELLGLINRMIELEAKSVLSISENRLFAYLSKANHAKLAQVLDDLRQEPIYFVNFEVSLFNVSEENWKAILKESSTSTLTEKQKEALFAKEKILRSIKFSTLNNQRVAISSGNYTSYVGDYDAEIAQQSSIGDPIIFSHMDGLKLSLKAAVGDESRGMLIEGKCALTETIKWNVVDLKNPSLGPLQHPEVRFQETQVVNWLEKGQVLAVGHFSEDLRLIVLIQPSLQLSTVKKRQN